ncbi:MAG: ABC transporter substrate-binding protein [bacterium]|nr:ABC transporter substrate-binding protein [bacterium]
MRHIAAAVVCSLCLAVFGVDAPVIAGQRIAVLYSDSTKHTQRTISGLEWSLKSCDPPCEMFQHYLSAIDEKQKSEVAALKPDILITIGSTATAFADKNFPAIPVVFAKVLNPIESGFIKSWDNPGGHVTGAALDIPVLQQIQKFSAVIPSLKRIGVVYTSNSQRLVEEARKACATLGLTLVEIKIGTSKELPAAIDSLCRVADGIWTIADELLSSPQFIRHTLVETLRAKIPIMGFNQNFVENGALFCLEADYKFIGRQAGELALALMNGKSVSTIKPTVPDVVYLYLNLKSGKLLNIDFAPELISVAKETY